MWLRKKFSPDYTGTSITQSDYVQVDWNTAREITGLIDSTYTVVENAAGLDSTAADVVEELNSIDIDCNDFKNIFSDVLEKLTSAETLLSHLQLFLSELGQSERFCFLSLLSIFQRH